MIPDKSETLTVTIIKEYAEAQLRLCAEENWFPDDDSKKEGYVWALEEILELIKKELAP